MISLLRDRLRAFRAWGSATPVPGDGVKIAVLGLVIRLGVVWWAARRFPPAEDGRYYDTVAGRIARGLGYTWEWPDGVVTFAAHYPIGYPALVGAVYALLGPKPVWAMVFNAVLGAAAVIAVHRISGTEASRIGAAVAALFTALHPGLLFYTPALMTEGVSAALLAVAGWVAVRRFERGLPAVRRAGTLGGLFGVLTLVRPQTLLLAPLFGFLWSGARLGRRCVAGLGVFAVAAALCLPWTIRNCHRMGSCVFVSANSGWNLFIGAAPGATGTWVPLDRLGVPESCRTVWGEAQKDACFRAAAVNEIRVAPIRFLSLVPRKLAATFDYAGAAGWYLHSSNPTAFDDADKLVLGVVETLWERGILFLALWSLAVVGPRLAARRGVVLLSMLALFTRSAWIAYVGLSIAGLLFGRSLLAKPAAALAAATVLGTAVTHAVFFGAGRYSLVCFPVLAALAGSVLTANERPGDTHPFKE